jgi:hypothetical protein
MGSRILALLSIVPLAALVFVSAACSNQGRDELFAQKTCATVLPAAKKMLRVREAVVHTRAQPGLTGWTAVRRFTESGTQAARTFHVRAVLIPAETDNSRKAKALVTANSRFAYARMVEERRYVRQLSRRPTRRENNQALAHLERTLGEVFAAMQGAIELAAIQVSDLADAFADSSHCIELEALKPTTS